MAQEMSRGVLDIDRLAQLTNLIGSIRVGEEVYPLIEPRGPVDDHMTFDRAVCSAGFKSFVRPFLESDLATGRATLGGRPISDEELAEINEEMRCPYILVHHVADGIRTRIGLQVRGGSKVKTL